jgi:N-ethylmaleimide reductase
MTATLFSPLSIGLYELAHRIVMAPLTRMRASQPGNVPSALNAEYYAQRASEGGLIISEGSQISRAGQGMPATPGIHTPEQIAGWKAVTEAVHAKRGRIFLQICHVGRISHSSHQPGGAPPIAPSAIAASGNAFTASFERVPFETPQAIDTDLMPLLIEVYGQAAANAKEAGFDGVEIHAANGYLIEQFLQARSNRRTDQYGGSIENRTRLTQEVVEAVLPAWGAGRVGIRLSPTTPDAGNTPMDSDVMATYGHLIRSLNRFNLAYLHFVEGATGGTREIPAGIDLDALRAQFEGPYIGNNGYNLDLAIDRRRAGKVDAVAFGCPFIANPDLVARLQHDVALAQAPRDAYYGGGAKGYIDWPISAS